MDRINNATAVDIGGVRQFTDGPPGTVVDASWLTAVQEEIMAVIEGANLVPSASDLTQLRAAIQGFASSSSLRYGPDTGAADAYAVTVAPAISVYADGLTIEFKAANSNTGASTINVSTLGVKDIKQSDGSALTAGMVRSGAIHILIYNSTAGYFQLVNKAA